MLTDERKQKRMGAALSFLERYHREDDELLDHMIAGDGTWVSHYAPESKRQSQEWHHAHSPTKKPQKFKQTCSVAKIMASVFWDRKGIFLIDFLPLERPLMQVHIAQH
jgi:hypothetical protein